MAVFITDTALAFFSSCSSPSSFFGFFWCIVSMLRSVLSSTCFTSCHIIFGSSAVRVSCFAVDERCVAKLAAAVSLRDDEAFVVGYIRRQIAGFFAAGRLPPLRLERLSWPHDGADPRGLRPAEVVDDHVSQLDEPLLPLALRQLRLLALCASAYAPFFEPPCLLALAALPPLVALHHAAAQLGVRPGAHPFLVFDCRPRPRHHVVVVVRVALPLEPYEHLLQDLQQLLVRQFRFSILRCFFGSSFGLLFNCFNCFNCFIGNIDCSFSGLLLLLLLLFFFFFFFLFLFVLFGFLFFLHFCGGSGGCCLFRCKFFGTLSRIVFQSLESVCILSTQSASSCLLSLEGLELYFFGLDYSSNLGFPCCCCCCCCCFFGLSRRRFLGLFCSCLVGGSIFSFLVFLHFFFLLFFLLLFLLFLLFFLFLFFLCFFFFLCFVDFWYLLSFSGSLFSTSSRVLLKCYKTLGIFPAQPALSCFLGFERLKFIIFGLSNSSGFSFASCSFFGLSSCSLFLLLFSLGNSSVFGFPSCSLVVFGILIIPFCFRGRFFDIIVRFHLELLFDSFSLLGCSFLLTSNSVFCQKVKPFGVLSTQFALLCLLLGQCIKLCLFLSNDSRFSFFSLLRTIVFNLWGLGLSGSSFGGSSVFFLTFRFWLFRYSLLLKITVFGVHKFILFLLFLISRKCLFFGLFGLFGFSCLLNSPFLCFCGFFRSHVFSIRNLLELRFGNLFNLLGLVRYWFLHLGFGFGFFSRLLLCAPGCIFGQAIETLCILSAELALPILLCNKGSYLFFSAPRNILGQEIEALGILVSKSSFASLLSLQCIKLCFFLCGNCSSLGNGFVVKIRGWGLGGFFGEFFNFRNWLLKLVWDWWLFFSGCFLSSSLSFASSFFFCSLCSVCRQLVEPVCIFTSQFPFLVLLGNQSSQLFVFRLGNSSSFGFSSFPGSHFLSLSSSSSFFSGGGFFCFLGCLFFSFLGGLFFGGLSIPSSLVVG
ncbi:hypothetical protein HG530_012878 [Fusarium avenaceum]|nr:hypothetical protein HG530_012878 [Fusarium avenaceum]